MSGLWGHLVGVLILVLMAVFLGIWVWAWRPRHRRVFDALAEIPMLDAEPRPAGGRAEAALAEQARDPRPSGAPACCTDREALR